MSEFVDALTDAVEADTARSRLPGAADAVRRGRRRSLRARGGVAVLGIAAIGGALGIGSAFGPGSGAAPIAPLAGQSSAYADDGMLPAEQWPGYDLAHWKPQLFKAPNEGVTKEGSLVLRCGDKAQNPPLFPFTRTVEFHTGYVAAYKMNADQTVWTFADEAKAEDFLADARTAGSAPACGEGDGAEVSSTGVSTASGVSWLLTQKATSEVDHMWVVRSGSRVTLLRVSQSGDAFKSTAGDKTVLENLEKALQQ
ncbi:MAG: hypothetical protein HOV87_17850 [Catenulispora sp.]|nr:hypothetical protein [Catenulispora sp.]